MYLCAQRKSSGGQRLVWGRWEGRNPQSSATEPTNVSEETERCDQHTDRGTSLLQKGNLCLRNKTGETKDGTGTDKIFQELMIFL